jgi:hypothetical protein
LQLDFEAHRKQFARELATRFHNANKVEKKTLRNHAKDAGVFSFFEDEIQTANARRKTTVEDRIR